MSFIHRTVRSTMSVRAGESVSRQCLVSAQCLVFADAAEVHVVTNK